MRKNIFIYSIIIASAIATRMLPHMWNLAPVSAMAIFGGLYLPKRQAVALPLIVRFTSDLIIGFFGWQLMIGVYASHLAGVGLGLWIRQRKTVVRVVAAPVMSALVFFLVTNFALLYSAQEYSHNFSGIILAYANGLPFLRGTLLGDFAYTLFLVGCYEAAVRIRATSVSRRAVPEKA